MARDLLSVQASTVASESAFSLSGKGIIDMKNKTNTGILEKCICLKDHLDAQERIQHILNLEGDCLEIEEQLLEVEAEAGYAINIADEEINLEEQAMSGSELINEEIRNSNAYQEYYAVATGVTPPKPKASVRKTRSSSDTMITPPTAAAGPRLTTSEKGKQAVKASKDKSLSALSEEELSWNSTDEKGDDDKGKDGDGNDDDNGDDGEEGDGDDEDNDDEDDDGEEGDDDADDQEVERDDEKDDEEEVGDDEEEYNEEEFLHAEEEPKDEESFDHIPKTPEDTDDEGNGEEDLGLNFGREERHDEEEEENELYRDVNINQGRGIQMNQEVKDSHVTLTPVNLDDQQQSLSVSSKFFTSMLNPTFDAGMESIFETTSQIDVQTPTSMAPLPMFVPTITPSIIATTLEANFFEFTQTNQFGEAVSAIPGIVHRYMDQQMNEAVQVAIQLQFERLREEAQKENDEFLKTIDENMKKITKKQVKEQVKILIEKMEGNKSIHRSKEHRNLYKALVEAYESDKIILDTYRDTVTLKRRCDDDADKVEEPSPRPDRGSKRCRLGKEPESASAPTEKATRSAGRSTQGTKSQQTSASKFPTAEEPMQTTFEMEKPAHLKFKTGADDQPIVESSQHPEWFSQQQKPPTPDQLLAGPTYELLKGSCKSLVELECHSEEVYKATTDQLDWVNPEGQKYPHNLLKPLPLIPNNQGRRVIPIDHFINNDLEYLRGGASSRKYTTSVTKTKAADYGHIKWIEDLVPGTIIIAVTKLKIVEWHNYKHLDWITVRRDNDKLYKFKEGDFKRLRIQDIKDMLLLLVQGKLTNLIVEERFAFNISLRMFTRSIRKEAYIAYSNPRGFIYQNNDKKNRLMQIDELHKFSDGMPIDVRTDLDERLKGIRMQSILTDLQVTPTKPGRITKPYSSHRFIANCFNARSLKMEVKVFRNMKDERGMVVKNKARLVAQMHTQEEGIDYDEVFAPVAWIEAIRLFLAYASFKDFVVYQMDVKSAFLYGKIEDEVYVCQPHGFEGPDFPDKVYKVEKALYGLHEVLRAWYETLSTYLIDNGFHSGQIDKTLFIKRHKDDILLVQVYVDDTIFGSTKKELSTEFEKLMHDNQDKYVADILKKFDFSTVKTTSTLMEANKALVKDAEAKDVDVHLYRSMIGSFIYLTASRPDITIDVCACVRFQVTPKTSHLHVVKRIFRYLKGQPKLGLWYPRDSPFDLEAYSDSNYTGASLDRKSTTGGCQFLGKMLILWQCKRQTIVANSTTKAEYVAAANCCGRCYGFKIKCLIMGSTL
nr:hypothetical protein [Tanacetum cinerariifolium]